MKLQDCLLRFERKGRVAAVASIFRDLESLQAAVMMEREVAGSRMSGPGTYRTCRKATVRSAFDP
jgi:hypothetical protein